MALGVAVGRLGSGVGLLSTSICGAAELVAVGVGVPVITAVADGLGVTVSVGVVVGE